MKLRVVPVPAINDLLVFETGSTEQRAVWNHVCGGTHCLVSEFDLNIKPLLNAHGVYDIQIDETAIKKKSREIAIEEDGDEILYLPETCVKCSSDKPLVMKLETRDWCCPDCGASYGSDK